MSEASEKMKIQAKSQDLWPTRIWHFDLSVLQPQYDAWLAHLNELRAATPTPAGRSNRYGWNSDKTIFEQPAFGKLHLLCRQAFVFAFREMGLKQQPDFQLEAWANTHDAGGFNVVHVHQNCLLSGCFYLQAPPGSGAIVLRDPRPGPMMAPFRTNGSNSSHPVKISPKAGLLLVFPNWLEHYVEPNDSDQTRVAIAMNASPGRSKSLPTV